ncbi:class I SAM-dependent methyltransferase [Actinoplanes sp. KI2]|uniref:class I SAM-dependent methyltransferase n=1 Tax=Actinoplanes sp. KI2 TaxID=2983315 RepID=UPI0021D5FA72|nr:class I SAM-dependent methyltransferase [Actinoplanes sp. KI2]MCU7722508.1 class I SAM-dependent methyltransferase [Actinoplanes sp. KI2]
MDILAQQRDYYRQRAPEYDQWWRREGRYTLDDQAKQGWDADIAEVTRALAAFAPTGHVLELAAGTGWWTERLTAHATHITAVDASTETLAINRERTAATGQVTYRQADIFTWTPPESTFDTVFFAYWLSHVPAEHLDAFWAKVGHALRPGGRVFLIDSYHPERMPDDLQRRRLNDGREFQVVKRFWQPAELEATPGWRLTAQITAHRHVIHAHGAPAR